MTDKYRVPRRDFLKQAAGALGAASQPGHWTGFNPLADENSAAKQEPPHRAAPDAADVSYPRQFSGSQLKMISFPLGGVAAGSIGLGGRGQLINWELYNHPDKGYGPPYAFPSIWVQSGAEEPVARVLESRILPPYEGDSGLGSDNAPGLSRLEAATFTGEYPLAHIDFHDRSLPVKVELDAFSPFIPHESDDSGLPVAILRYRATNLRKVPAKVGIAFSIDNPVKSSQWTGSPSDEAGDKRSNDFRSENGTTATGTAGEGLAGLFMSNLGLAADDLQGGSFALAAMPSADGRVSHWKGWPKGRWWNSPLLFWDQFSKAGELGAQPDSSDTIGVLCLQKTILPGQSADFSFLLGWHFPNRTPDGCGWEAPPGEGKTIIGNYYATRFRDAWDAVSYAAKNLESLESRTRMFAAAFRESTLPGAVKDAASANLSTLATTTCFRTADGEFHGFEGSSNRMGCCFGNCTHVWNYETVTSFLFPSFAKSLRKSAFGYSMDDQGGMHFRQLLPEGKGRSGFVAADGQMGQIMHAWLDWKLAGDDAWLRELWPRLKRAIEFAWIPGGWDSNRDGVLEGVQHNTYDVEFYGPNPMCGIYYLGALRAGQEMALAVGDGASAREYGRLFEQGRQWIDANLFNGEYYVQQIRGFRKDEISPSLRSDMGSENTETPEYQVGGGCLIDQLVGQYLADAGGLGPLVSERNIRATMSSIYRYNYKSTLADHENVARTFALNEEAAVVVCDYAKTQRPHIPFPYYSEVFTGTEYTAAALLMGWGMVDEGIECVRNTRLRYDGEKRNPWDEAECGHHYARAMSAWSTIVALSGFRYDGVKASVIAVPRLSHEIFNCFWATGTGWGTFSYQRQAGRTHFAMKVLSGTLRCRSCEITGSGSAASVQREGLVLANSVEKRDERLVVTLSEIVSLSAKSELRIEVLP